MPYTVTGCAEAARAPPQTHRRQLEGELEGPASITTVAEV